jgi:MFS family permease
MSGVDTAKPDETRWHLSLIPLYMAVGSSGLLVTLVALSLGASVADIGVMAAAGSAGAIVLSVVWGRLSDFSGRRKKYLLFFFIALGPIFLALSMANSVPQLILLYAALASIASGIAPIAIMYTVECYKSKNWQEGVGRYNSLTSVGNLLGLLTYAVVAEFYETRWLFYVSAAMCFLAFVLLWRTGREPEITLERNPFPVRNSPDSEKIFSPKSIWGHLDIRRFKIPRNLKQLKPLQLLFLASFVHWTGISFFGVGQTPLMRSLGLSDSLILVVNSAAGAASAIAFVRIAPHMKSNGGRLLNRVVFARGGLILCWAVLPLFSFPPVSSVFIFLLIASIVWSILYAIIWLPITNYAISQAPVDRKGSVQGELLSATGVANAIGSALGGLVITAYGYTIGFIFASIIAMLTIPIISRIDVIESD